MAENRKIKINIKVDPRFEKLPLKNLYVISFVLNVLAIVSSLFATFILPPEVPLLFGLPQTEEQIVPSFLVSLPNAVALIITVLNALLAIYLDDAYLKRVLSFVSLAITILSLIATSKIIFLVGSI